MNYVLITWATSWIGLATAKAFAAKKENLILVGRNKEKLTEIKKNLNEIHWVEIFIFQVDVTRIEHIDEMFYTLKKEDIHISACINNAGLALWEDAFDCVEWQDLETMIQTNIVWATKIAHAVLPFLKETSGHLFMLSSIAGREAYNWGHVYWASKAYISFLSKSIRLEVHGSWVRVTDIAPGSVDTEGFSLTRFKWDQEKFEKVYAWYEPLHAENIADAIIHAYSAPKHVNLQEMLIMPTAQSAARRIHRS